MIAGGTQSRNHIRVGCTYSGVETIVPTGFMAKFYSTGKIMWGSYFDTPLSAIIAAKEGKSFYMAAFTGTDGLATPGAFEPAKNGSLFSGFIVKMEGDFICPVLNINIDRHGDSLTIPGNFQDFQWYRNGVLQNGSNNLLVVSEPGDYYAVLKNNCDCIYTSDTVHVDSVTEIKVVNGDFINFELYPNPNNGVFQLRGTFNTPSSELAYYVTDLQGRTLYSGKLNVEGVNFKQDLDFPSLANGLYFLKLKGDEVQITLKWIKMR